MNQEQGANWMTRLRAPQIEPPWSIADVATTFVALVLAMILGASLASPTLEAAPNAPTLLLGWIIGEAIAAAFVLITRRRTPEDTAALRLVAGRLPAIMLILLGVAAGLVIDLVVASLSQTFIPVPQLLGVGVGGNFDWVLAFFFVVMIQPVAEGLVFAGVILPRLRASLGPWPGLLLMAALYALFHALIFAPQLDPTLIVWYGVVMPFLVALVMGAVRVANSSTRAAIFVNMGVGLLWWSAAFVLLA